MADDWKLTAPWWRWPKLGTPDRDVKSLPPAVQKYDTSDPVSLFVKEPQKALAYTEDDLAHTLVTGSGNGKISSFTNATLVPTTTRKIFLPLHKRFYLVAFELHCDAAGFPSVSRDQVCEAGMVIRRRRLIVGDQFAPQALQLLATIREKTARIATLDRGLRKRVLQKRHRVPVGGPVGMMTGPAVAKSKVGIALNQAAVEERAKLDAELVATRQQLLEWKAASGVTVLSEGWIPGEFENVGSWQVVDSEPQGIEEVVYPMFPLVADPRVGEHDAAGKALWFGMLPTGSREVDVTGAARFDDEWRYEVRCFVRRHRPECPRTDEPNDCGGTVYWSAPTKAFQFAGHFDPAGTGNQPITIQMPDIPALAASPPKLPVQMKFPAGSALNFKVEDGEAKDPTTNGFPQICFFSIPLITIIAMFVLNLFLPIVVFLFQLWFLLGLKFCIPPSLTVGAGVAVDLDVQGELELDAQLDASIDVAIGASAGTDLINALAADLNLALTGNAFADVDETTDTVNPFAGFEDTPGGRMSEQYTTSFLREINESVVADRADEVEDGSIIEGLAYVPRVEREEVGA
ncbi:MAG: hypothetical protein GEU90_09115 [Gemmatimonas sp.]|nr:hypothetical protein [Gemmatimonas sp.]